MSLRLQVLDDATLAAATSQGLLRRAHRDVAAGAVRLRRQDADEALIETGDAVVTLRAGGLVAASCTCPSTETCRHILAAIILLRDVALPETNQTQRHRKPRAAATAAAPPASDPVTEITAYTKSQLAKLLGKALLARAEESLPPPQEVTITTRGATCVITFNGRPEVRYVAGLGIKGMLCKADPESARLLRAQALLAVRRAHAREPAETGAAPRAPLPAKLPDTSALLERAGGVLIEWALAGLAAAPLPLEDRLFDAAIAARAAGLYRLSAELRRLSEDVRRRRERDAELGPLESLRAAARAFALVEALKRSPADGSLRGHARDTFDSVGDLKLTGCGYEIWQTPAGARGATAYFRAPAGQRWFSASLARASSQDSSFEPTSAVSRESVWGSTLAVLSASEVTLRGAAASPGGRLSLSREVKASLAPGHLKQADLIPWDASFQDWHALASFVHGRFVPALRGARAGGALAVLLPARTGRPRFDEVAQELSVPLFDRNGKQLSITVANVPHHQRRLLALEEFLERKSPDAFFVTLSMAGERISINPYALLAGPDTAPISLDAPAQQAEEAGLRALSERLRRGVAQLTTDLARPQVVAQTATGRLLNAAFDLLLGLCELGGQMHDPRLLEKLGALCMSIESTGLRPAALLLDAVRVASGRQRARAILVAAYAVSGLQQLLSLPA
jgi:hypothetical protein